MDFSLSMAAKEAHQGLDGLPMPMPHKAAKKHKKAVLFFEVEIRDAKTREKLCFLDKVGLCPGGEVAGGPAPCPSEGTRGVLSSSRAVVLNLWAETPWGRLSDSLQIRYLHYSS